MLSEAAGPGQARNGTKQEESGLRTLHGREASWEKRLAVRSRICKYIDVFEVHLSEGVEKDLRAIKAHDREQVLDAIERQLSQQANVETRNRKILVNLIPPFENVPPVWELRVGDYRVFYDVDQEEEVVYVRAVRHKPPHKTMEEIL
jgi:mRNA-degrading endonuclease RelE of RelBE toxin-antitoxin system